MFFKYENIVLKDFKKYDNSWFFSISINDGYIIFDFAINFKNGANITELLNDLLFPKEISDDDVLNYIEHFEKNCNLVVSFNSIQGKYFEKLQKNLKYSEAEARKFLLQNFFNNQVFKATFYNFKALSMLVNNKVIEFEACKIKK